MSWSQAQWRIFCVSAYTKKMPFFPQENFLLIKPQRIRLVMVINSIVRTTVSIVTTTITVVAAASEIVTTTIQICCGCINKTLCWGNKSHFLRELREKTVAMSICPKKFKRKSCVKKWKKAKGVSSLDFRGMFAPCLASPGQGKRSNIYTEEVGKPPARFEEKFG